MGNGENRVHIISQFMQIDASITVFFLITPEILWLWHLHYQEASWKYVNDKGMFIVTRNDDINFMTRCCGKDHISIHMILYDSSRYDDNQQRLDLLVCSESVYWLHMFKLTFNDNRLCVNSSTDKSWGLLRRYSSKL